MFHAGSFSDIFSLCIPVNRLELTKGEEEEAGIPLLCCSLSYVVWLGRKGNDFQDHLSFPLSFSPWEEMASIKLGSPYLTFS